MRKRTLRVLFKLSALLNLALLAGVVWDYLVNQSRWMAGLLVAYAAFLAILVLLFFARPQAPAQAPRDPRPLDDSGQRLTIAQRP